jgi:hypothetical protein
MARKQTTKKTQRKRTRIARSPATFGPVSQINTAPVSVGNSVRGSKPRVTQTVNGARVVGRDFAFALSGTVAAINNWELIGGMPLTPCVLPSSILRNYCQMFADFKVNAIVVHYITSSPTSQAGDIMFYYERDRLAPMCDYTNSSFLPYVLSDSNTVIGPQWTNHSMIVKPVPEWKSTLYANQTDLNEDAAGTLFMFSKTNAANSPGYVLIDYDISFKELSVNPRAGSLPVARGQSTFVCLTNNNTTITLGGNSAWVLDTGKTISGVTSTAPNNYQTGDIYKVVFQTTASQQANPAWVGTPTAPTPSTLLRFNDDTGISFDDGFTLYGRLTSAQNFRLYASLENAVTDTQQIEYNMSGSAVTVNICAEIQLVRNVDLATQSAY